MQLKTARLQICIALATILSAVGWAQAAFVLWSNSSGTNANLSWFGGGSKDGLWGDPDINGPNFSFTPDEFALTVSNGNADTLDSRLEFNVNILNGEHLAGFAIQETGLYSILGGGSVKAFGSLIVQDRDTLQQYTASLVTTPGFPVSTGGSVEGQWSGLMQVVLPEEVNIVHATIIADNLLQASSNLGGSAYIDKKTMPAAFSISAVFPEPSMLGMLVCGLPLLLRRMKRNGIN